MSTSATAHTKRPYRSEQREAQARATRRQIVAAATTMFVERGYAVTTVRAVAEAARVSRPAVELVFGTKARLLKAAIDVAIVGDDEPVAVLERETARQAEAAPTAGEFCSVIGRLLGPAQARSAGLVLAAFEGSRGDPELGELVGRLVDQRAGTAGWIVDTLLTKAEARVGRERAELVDVVWLLMDPAVYDRFTRQRHWTTEQYERWFADALRRLVTELSA